MMSYLCLHGHMASHLIQGYNFYVGLQKYIQSGLHYFFDFICNHSFPLLPAPALMSSLASGPLYCPQIIIQIPSFQLGLS